ncbi:MAG: hypothetical protein ABI863_22585 [Ginsengibacter sp.]
MQKNPLYPELCASAIEGIYIGIKLCSNATFTKYELSILENSPMKYFLILIIFFFYSCTKEHSCENCMDNISYKNATIIFGGAVATDGCGWLVKTDDIHTYQPDVLNAAFQQNQLPVKISYELTPDKFTCGIGGLQIPVIHVIDIKL